MNEITITKLLEYYFKDGLSFTDIMHLYSAGKISLSDGMVSEQDLRIIVADQSLPALDLREFAAQAAEETGREDDEEKEEAETQFSKSDLEESIRQSEKAIFTLEKQARKKNGEQENAERELIKEYTRISDCYEQMGDAVSAVRYRGRLKELLETTVQADECCIADNLLKLGELCVKTNSFKEALSLLRDAKEKYEAMLEKIRLSDARDKSEHTAKLGIIYYLMYCAEEEIDKKAASRIIRLNEAQKLLIAYSRNDETNKYSKYIKKIRQEQGKKCHQ